MIKFFFTKISVFHSFIISDQNDNIPRYYFARKQNFAKRSYFFCLFFYKLKLIGEQLVFMLKFYLLWLNFVDKLKAGFNKIKLSYCRWGKRLFRPFRHQKERQKRVLANQMRAKMTQPMLDSEVLMRIGMIGGCMSKRKSKYLLK